jgi:DNA polymerase
MMIGEGPGRVEEEKNCFFIGPAGTELDSSLATLSIPMDKNFFICNAVQCRPHPPEGVRKENRAPTPDEISACRHNLDRIVELHQPELIILIGGVAAKAVLKEPPRAVGAIVGRFSGPDSHTLKCNADIYSIWHPAYILRNMEKKKEWMRQLVVLRDYLLGRRLVEGR